MFKFSSGPKSPETRFRYFCDIFVSVPLLFWQKKFFIFVGTFYRRKNCNFLKEKKVAALVLKNTHSKAFQFRLSCLTRTLSGCWDSAGFSKNKNYFYSTKSFSFKLSHHVNFIFEVLANFLYPATLPRFFFCWRHTSVRLQKVPEKIEGGSGGDV